MNFVFDRFLVFCELQLVNSFGLRGVRRYKDAPSEKSGVDRVSSRAQESIRQGSQHNDTRLHDTASWEMRPIEQHGGTRDSTDDGSQQAEAKHTEQAKENKVLPAGGECDSSQGGDNTPAQHEQGDSRQTYWKHGKESLHCLSL
jgi:hypothetical protein